MNSKTHISAYMITFLAFLLIFAALPAYAQDQTVARAPGEILAEAGDTPTPAAINELFINVSEWDDVHADVQNASRDVLIEMGVLAVPTLLDGWLASVDVRRRVELDAIIAAIGQSAAQYLIRYLQSEDPYTRRHAAYLLGDTCAIDDLDDPLAIGPAQQDIPALDALVAALQVETDWHAVQSILGSIGRMRDPARIALLASYTSNEEQAIRIAAVVALGRIPVQDAVPPLMNAFGDSVMTVREAAVLALATKTMGNLAFEALVGRAILPATGTRIRLCALEALSRYLETIASEDTQRAIEQRTRAYDAAKTVLGVAANVELWRSRGFAVEVIGHTYQPDAAAFLTDLAATEHHPFVLGKINAALDLLAEGRPAPPVDAN